MSAFLNPWVILSLVLAIAGAFGGRYYKGNSAGQAEVQQKWDKEKTEQYEAYAKVVRAFGQRPVIIRTFDVGGEFMRGAPFYEIARVL